MTLDCHSKAPPCFASPRQAHFSNLAMCHLKHGPNLQKARTNCTKALEIDPKNVKALFRRGKCHAQLGMLDEGAPAEVQRATRSSPFIRRTLDPHSCTPLALGCTVSAGRQACRA